jgi:hypothetical protein
MAKIPNLPDLTPIVPDDPTASTTTLAPSPAAIVRKASAPNVSASPTPSLVPVAAKASAADVSASPAPSAGLADLADLDAWSGITSAATHKLPVELLKLLDKRMSAVGLTKTATISAALLELLSYDDAELVRRVDAFQERYERARRRARRTG